jgi:hypothetical protein
MKKDIIQMGCFKYEYENKFIEIINNAKEKFIDESEVNENKFELSDEDEQIEDEPDDNE